MPKKSREQKIRASQRLYESLRQQPSLREATQEKTAAAPRKDYFSKPVSAPVANEHQLTKYFMADFRKSLLLIGSVIALEIFFYFASMSSNFAWLFKF